MSLSDRLARLNHLQRSLRFKVVATIVVVLAAVVGFSVWWTVLNAPDAGTDARPGADQAPAAQTAPADEPLPDRDSGQATAQPQDPGSDLIADRGASEFEPRLDPQNVLSALGSRDATLGVALGAIAAAGVSVIVIWLGAGLTYLAIALAAALVVVPLRLIPATEGVAALLAGVAALAASFTIFIELARALLSSSHPVFAIARTVVSEAVRMKISLVFILLLIGWLASLPFLLDDAQPLRFRVQTFLQNGTAGAFWSLALLTMFFAVATVAFEQRDKIIWSTIVKPVKAWHYILGKWLGVMAVNAAMLAVAASGVFLFTEYLRAQPARGEIAPYVAADGSGRPTQDRLILEARVLTARAAVAPELPPISPERVEQRLVERLRAAQGEATEIDPAMRARMREALIPSVIETLEAQRTAIAPFDVKDFVFPDLDEAKALGKPITLRYKIQAGANDPTELVAVLFEFVDSSTGQVIPMSIDAPLNVAQSIDLRPIVIGEDGELILRVYNGDPVRRMGNDLTIRFPPDGLEVLYAKGGYETNFLRVTVSLLIKLGFIAAAAIFAATFLSFPVAALLAFLVLFAAETSGFLAGSLEIYSAVDQQGDLNIFKFIVKLIASPVATVFTGYRSLDSVDRLVDGKLLSWSEFAGAGAVILLLSFLILALATLIFKKRELATYSGH